MIEIRFTMGLIAVVLMAMVAWGYRHSATWGTIRQLVSLHGGRPAIENHRDFAVVGTRMALTILHLKGIFRIGWWDVVRPALGWVGVMPPSPNTTLTFSINLAFSVIAITASLIALTALWSLIPQEDRGKWSIFTAPFYPWGLRFRISLRGKK
ncbi:hypothetical protein [Pseudooceanicola nitratireducens]|uniref:hypothetical protein n=1 Tax=Pseudooceanicola nitratireducens TaxID=517719 RepID=UPI003C7E95C3